MEGQKSANGVFKRFERGGGFLRDPERSFQRAQKDVWVQPAMVREFQLVDGATILGTEISTKKGRQLDTINSICGLAPEAFRSRQRFDRLQAVNPDDRIHLGDSGNLSMRIIDLLAPIGKGTRGLIVSPPKAGKTQLLEDMAAAIRQSEPEDRVIVLLIDERPEEVTHFRRNVDAEVLASSSDQSLESHINLVELVMSHIRCELECRRDVVVLVDSITRMARAFNLAGKGSKRTLSGGLDARAMEIPRRFFGLARNVENGGSVTVIATAQVDTGSRMDGYIFEEFKSTGNSEIVLDRSLAELRIFPAINILASGTRREELLCSEDELQWVALLRRHLAAMDPGSAMRGLIKLIRREKTNRDLIRKLDLTARHMI